MLNINQKSLVARFGMKTPGWIVIAVVTFLFSTGAALPIAPRPTETVSKLYAPAAKPAGIDLDVTYIRRTPLYNRYSIWYTDEGTPYLQPGTENDKRWPAQGEMVTFTAHVI